MDSIEYLRKFGSDFNYSSIFNEENNNKNLLVVWSGGCDSTLLLYNLLSVISQKGSNRVVNTISFKSNQLGIGKPENEENARKKFKQFCKKEGLNLGENRVIDISNIPILTGNSERCPQVPMWLYNILATCADNSLIFTGYIRGDDFFTVNIFNSWFKAQQGLSELYGKRDCRFVFPLLYNNKLDVITRLKELKLYNMTTYCEEPKGDLSNCGECEACKKHIAYLHIYNKKKRKYKEDYKKYSTEIENGPIYLTVDDEIKDKCEPLKLSDLSSKPVITFSKEDMFDCDDETEVKNEVEYEIEENG